MENNTKKPKMLTKEQISEKIINEIESALDCVMHDFSKPIVDNVDMENQEITLTFKWNHVKEDNYIGLANY